MGWILEAQMRGYCYVGGDIILANTVSGVYRALEHASCIIWLMNRRAPHFKDASGLYRAWIWTRKISLQWIGLFMCTVSIFMTKERLKALENKFINTCDHKKYNVIGWPTLLDVELLFYSWIAKRCVAISAQPVDKCKWVLPYKHPNTIIII